MGCTDNFFEKKRGWSILKDQIIKSYLTPYMMKVKNTKRPLAIIDCFAGKGKFDDGNIGSPIIIADHIKDHIAIGNKSIRGMFIEKKYANALNSNLSGYENCQIYRGLFEEHLGAILAIPQSTNVFLYIDPYGIKSLDFSIFSEIKKKSFASTEILINFNSFGFLREGCRLLKYKDIIDDDGHDFYEVDAANTIEHMDSIANGTYWRDILTKYNSGDIDMHQAEEAFTSTYASKLKSIFKYVVNVPIKTKSKNIPKYRIIFGTNHEDGLLLMSEEMHKAWKKIVENDREGQKVLFEYDFPDSSLDPGFSIDNTIIDILKNAKHEVDLKGMIVKLIELFGISFSEKYYKGAIKELNGKAITLKWTPPTTSTGRPATGMDYKKYTIKMSLK